MNKKKRVDCFKCEHFFTTWDSDYPRGCRIMGFKGKEIPSGNVVQASGMDCLKFEEKKATSLYKKKKR